MNICIIGARSGSSLAHKNIRKLGGRYLIDWAIKPALRSKLIDMVLVSTDSQEYANIAKQCGACVPFLRPEPLWADTPSELFVQHAVHWLEDNMTVFKEYPIEIIVLLQATSPFISTEDIDACITALKEDPSAESAITVRKVKDYPQWMFKQDGKYIHRMVDKGLQGDDGVRQTLPPLWFPNGMCYANRYNTIMKKGKMIGDKCIPIFVPNERSVDIDHEIDFVVAESVGKYLGLIK